jgi:hypothetical protein
VNAKTICECLNACGDDGRVRAGSVKGCAVWQRTQAERLHAQYVRTLAKRIRQPIFMDVVSNGLAYIVREYPDRSEQARYLIHLIAAIHMGPEGYLSRDGPLPTDPEEVIFPSIDIGKT